MTISKTRLLFALTVVWGCMVFWLAPHPPMVDLPQHAGQITLLRDIVSGQSPWSELFRINLLTPYLIGYGLALPLSFLMPVVTVLKIMLTLAYVAFVFMSVKLRKHFGADERLDWIFLACFFGFVCQFGFFTFLIAAPVAMFFILVSDGYAEHQTVGRGLATLATGLILLISHGLVFLFALMIAFAFLLVRTREVRKFVLKSWPLVILVLVCGVYFLISQKTSAEMKLSSGIEWSIGSNNFFGLGRVFKVMLYTVSLNLDNLHGFARVIQLATIPIFFGAPWLLGLRVDFKNRPSWIPFAVIALIFATVPSVALSTGYLYQRFALFLLPTYAWMFTRRVEPAARFAITGAVPKLVMPLVVLCCWGSLTAQIYDTWKFGQETAAIDDIVSSLKPGKRALALILERSSIAANNGYVYIHYPLWYQAENQGLVDYNFAWLPPQIVRYRLDSLPAVGPNPESDPDKFTWAGSHGDDYYYFFVRSAAPVPADFFHGASCRPKLIAANGMWSVFENLPCA